MKTLSVEQVVALNRRTEGWIAGLQMAALSMRGRDDVSGFIQAFTGSHRYILDYLTEEVLNQQSEEIQVFLMQTSILDRFTGPLCNIVTGQTDGRSTLEVLEAANLFVIPLDEERLWYRYHPLFADLLRQRLQRESRILVPELHHRASEWFQKSGLIPEAVSHTLAAGDAERAASLIERIALPKLMPREMNTLQGWLDELPNEIVQGRPQLGIARAWALAVSGEWDAVEPSLADVDIQQVQGEAATVRAYIALRQGDVASTIELAHQALEQLPAEDSFFRATVALDLGVAYSSKYDLASAERTLNEAIMVSRAAGLTSLTVAAMSTLGHIQDTQGLLHKSVETQRKAIELAHEPDGQSMTKAGMAYVGIAEVQYEWNDLDGALHNAMQGIKLFELSGFTSYQLVSLAVLTRVYQAWGELDKAMEVIKKAERLAQRHQYAFVKPMLTYLRVRFYVAQGDVEAAYRWAQEHGLNLDDKLENAPESMQSIGAWLLVVRASSQIPGGGRELDKVLSLLTLMLEAEQAAGRMWNVIKFLTLQALAFQAQGEINKALPVLEQALSLAEPEGYIRTFVDEGEIMERLLIQALSHNIAPNYVAMLLAALRETKEISQTKVHSLIDPLSERELEVLRLIAGGLSNQEIAQQLVVAVSTVKSHINHIYGKLSANSRTQAVARARGIGIL
jgi:LuxR family maltose regulon positive regulatory protein